MDFIANNIKLYKQEAPLFEKLFGVKLKPFFDNVTGFDIVKFDNEVIKTPEDESMADVIRLKYGKEAEFLCVRLIGVR